VRSDGSRDFADSPQRIPTVHLSFLENLSSCGPTSLRLPSNFQGTWPLCLPSTPSKVQILLNFLHDFESFRKLLARTPCGRPSNTSSVEILRLCAHLQQQSLNTSLRFTNSETLLGLRTPCTAPVPNCTSE
jgi:hypothetical protein